MSSTQMSSTQMSTIEKMPAEIQHMILLSMPDFASLAGLVHASPSYHAAYVSKRDAILATITVRELKLRSLWFFTPGDLLEVWIHQGKKKKKYGEHEKAEWQRIFDHCYEQAITSGIMPNLSAEQSILLLGVEAVKLRWTDDGGYAREGPILKRKLVNSFKMRETLLPSPVLNWGSFRFTVNWATPQYMLENKRKGWINCSRSSRYERELE